MYKAYALDEAKVFKNVAVANKSKELTSQQVKGMFNLSFTWAGIICVIVIIAAGAMYTLSAGNTSRIQKAKMALIGAVIGLVIIIMAFAIVNFVVGNI
mgnify:CR=1 FL=1